MAVKCFIGILPVPVLLKSFVNYLTFFDKLLSPKYVALFEECVVVLD